VYTVELYLSQAQTARKQHGVAKRQGQPLFDFPRAGLCCVLLYNVYYIIIIKIVEITLKTFQYISRIIYYMASSE
jgi:hypothetical protein